jgi:thioredoxin-like negative regulator of GroEL
MKLRITLISVFLLFSVGIVSAFTQYNSKAFEAAQATGKPLLVQVHADWCPICAKQKPILADLLAQTAMKDYQVLDVDFDTQKDVLRQLNVQKQSTLIIYKGKQELGRSTGETDKEKIAELLRKAL